MTTDEELQDAFASRLHGLVSQPPAGRNLMPGIHKAAHRRRTRVAAVSSSLGVTGVVVAGAVTATSLKGSPAAQPIQAAAATSAPAATATPSVPATTTTPAPPTDKVPPTSAVPTHVMVAPRGDSAAELRAAPYYYQRSIFEQDGQRSERRIWQAQTGNGHVEQPGPDPAVVISMSTGPADFMGEGGQPMTWADFSSTPTSAQMHQWLYGSTGTRLAFKDVHDLLAETPTSKAFRLVALHEIEQIPGVTVTSSVTDEVGRNGKALTLGDTRYIVDPTDGRLLQEELLSAGCTGSSNVAYRSVLLEAGSVGAGDEVLAPQTAGPTGVPADCGLAGLAGALPTAVATP